MSATLFTKAERMGVPIGDFAHPEDVDIFGPSFGADTYYGDYAGIARRYKPQAILEIGVRYGYSGIAMCLGAIAAGVIPMYHGCDAEYFVGRGGQEHLSSNAVARINFARAVPKVPVKLYSVNTRFNLLPDEVRATCFDLVNIDGDHSYYGCLNDMVAAWRLLRPGGIMIVDDTGMRSVKAAIETFLCAPEDSAAAHQWYANERGFALLQKGSQ